MLPDILTGINGPNSYGKCLSFPSVQHGATHLPRHFCSAMLFFAVALQGMSATAQGQSFIGHSDAVTGLAWAGPDTLISTGASDSVLIWRLTPAALEAWGLHSKPTATAACQPLLPLGAPVQAPKADPALGMTQAFDSFSVAADESAMRQSLEATAGMLQSSGLAESAAAAEAATAAPAADQGLQLDPTATISLMPQAASAADASATLPVSQHPLLAKTGNSLLQQQEAVHCIPTEAGLHLERVVGFSGAQHGCCVWLPETGHLVYATDQFLVLEELASREQRWACQHCCTHHDSTITVTLSILFQRMATTDTTLAP